MSTYQEPVIDGLIYLGLGFYGLPGYGKRATVRVYAAPSHPDEWTIFSIKVQPSRRGRGLGGRLLKATCAAADAQGVCLRLTVESLHPVGLDDSQLGDWYERHGFQYEDDLRFMMVRHPKERD